MFPVEAIHCALFLQYLLEPSPFLLSIARSTLSSGCSHIWSLLCYVYRLSSGGKIYSMPGLPGGYSGLVAGLI